MRKRFFPFCKKSSGNRETLHFLALRLGDGRGLQRKIGRGDRIRTCDLLVPNQALYQAKLHPETSDIKTLVRKIAGREKSHHPPVLPRKRRNMAEIAKEPSLFDKVVECLHRNRPGGFDYARGKAGAIIPPQPVNQVPAGRQEPSGRFSRRAGQCRSQLKTRSPRHGVRFPISSQRITLSCLPSQKNPASALPSVSP